MKDGNAAMDVIVVVLAVGETDRPAVYQFHRRMEDSGG
jgi:hypothetical protein